MKLIMNTYPGFQALPKGVKKMLLVSESFYFDEMRRPNAATAANSIALSVPSFNAGLAGAPGIVEALNGYNVASVQRSTV